MEDRLLNLDEVLQIMGLARSTLYDLIRAGKFPAPIPLGCRITRFSALEVEAHIEARKSARISKGKTRSELAEAN